MNIGCKVCERQENIIYKCLCIFSSYNEHALFNGSPVNNILYTLFRTIYRFLLLAFFNILKTTYI